MEKSTPLWCEDCRFVSFETGLGKLMLTLNDPNGFKNSKNVYSIHLELRMALPCQISTGKWKYVNPCLDFLGIPDQRTAYVKRQARPRWTYVRRSSVTPDLFTRYVKLRVAHAPEMPGRFTLPPTSKKKTLVSDPGTYHGTCVTHVPGCMSGSLTPGGGEIVPGTPGACKTRTFTYLARGPWLAIPMGCNYYSMP